MCFTFMYADSLRVILLSWPVVHTLLVVFTVSPISEN